jgi:hypothetical protein
MRIATAIVVVLGVAVAGACSPSSKAPDGTSKPREAEAYVCHSDADCVMSCESKGECCANPCGCDTVRHKDEHAAIQAYNRKDCATDDYDCPDVGACAPSYEYATPRCREGACVAELPPSRKGESVRTTTLPGG